MNQITITLPDSTTANAAAGDSVFNIIGAISAGLQKASLAARVDGVTVDLSYSVSKNASVQAITFDSPAGKDIFWHSASHLMAQAVRRLFPDVKFAIGPSIEDINCTLLPESASEIYFLSSLVT